MSAYEVRFYTKAEITVTIDAPDEDIAGDEAWEIAQAYLDTLTPDSHGTAINASLDGIGAEEIKQVTR